MRQNAESPLKDNLAWERTLACTQKTVFTNAPQRWPSAPWARGLTKLKGTFWGQRMCWLHLQWLNNAKPDGRLCSIEGSGFILLQLKCSTEVAGCYCFCWGVCFFFFFFFWVFCNLFWILTPKSSNLCQGDTHSSVLAWRILGTGEPGGLPSMGSHRVGHDWSDLAVAADFKDFPINHLTKINLHKSIWR